jgi:hypothetical protein
MLNRGLSFRVTALLGEALDSVLHHSAFSSFFIFQNLGSSFPPPTIGKVPIRYFTFKITQLIGAFDLDPP